VEYVKLDTKGFKPLLELKRFSANGRKGGSNEILLVFTIYRCLGLAPGLYPS
jgi:hypothetical protein